MPTHIAYMLKQCFRIVFFRISVSFTINAQTNSDTSFGFDQLIPGSSVSFKMIPVNQDLSQESKTEKGHRR